MIKKFLQETYPNVNQHFVLAGFTLEWTSPERFTLNLPDQVTELSHKKRPKRGNITGEIKT